VLLSVVFAALIPVSFPVPSTAQVSSPWIVDADQVIYDDAAQTVAATGHVSLRYGRIQVKADFARLDLRQERLDAVGHVIVIDRAGRELRGERMNYYARDQLIDMSPAETTINGVYIRSVHMRARPELIVADESFLTTCDPAHPDLHLTASRVEVIPGDRADVYDAAFWVGESVILSWPAVTISLRNEKETAGSFPRIGYTNIEGLYAAYRFAFFVGAPLAFTSVSLGTLAQRGDVGLLLVERPLGFLPISYAASASTGWHREFSSCSLCSPPRVAGVDTWRAQYTIELTTPAISLGPQIDWQTSWKWQDITYGTGARQSVLRTHSAVTHYLTTDATLTLDYNVVRVYGGTPLALDLINPDDLIDRLRLGYTKTGIREDVIATKWRTGPFYDFPTSTMSFEVAYGERIPKRYNWEFNPQYNLNTRVVTLISDTGIALGTDTYFTVQANYNTATTVFTDLDYILTAQIRSCVELSVEYRQMRQQLLISVGLPTGGQGSPQAQTRANLPQPCGS
jgi:lipopolysaccharide export system protein LptA